jgi:hypothetical protein
MKPTMQKCKITQTQKLSEELQSSLLVAPKIEPIKVN